MILAAETLKPPFKAAILVISDRAYSGERPDRSGPVLKERLVELGWEVRDPEICQDDTQTIKDWLQRRVDSGQYDSILTSGGTGLAYRDVTPEATLQVIEKRVPGLEEAMRAHSVLLTPHAMLSRAVAGVAKRTLIINLPGSPQGGLDNLKVIEPALPHAVALLRGQKPDP